MFLLSWALGLIIRNGPGCPGPLAPHHSFMIIPFHFLTNSQMKPLSSLSHYFALSLLGNCLYFLYKNNIMYIGQLCGYSLCRFWHHTSHWPKSTSETLSTTALETRIPIHEQRLIDKGIHTKQSPGLKTKEWISNRRE